MDAALLVDLGLKAALAALVLTISTFFGGTFLGFAWYTLFPGPAAPPRARKGGRFFIAAMFGLMGAMFAWPGIVVLILTAKHLYWLAIWDLNSLRIAR